MDSLDLAKAPPRSPYVRLGGLLMLAWIRKHSDASRYDAVNASLEEITLAQRLDRPEFVQKYPVAKTLPPETTLLRMLELDDAKSFA